MQTNVRKVRTLGFSLDKYEALIQGEWKPLEPGVSEKVLKIYETLKDSKEVKSLFVFNEKTGDLQIIF